MLAKLRQVALSRYISFCLVSSPFVVADAVAQTTTQTYAISAGDLGAALNQFAAQSRLQILFSPELVQGKTTKGLSGIYTPDAALKEMLRGSDLSAESVNASTFLVKRIPAAAPPAPAAAAASHQASSEAPAELNEIVVTGQLSALRRAQEIKKGSIGTVDSVSSEEAGQFPDQNVADALQRLPGVSVNRGNGESKQITIRGFGPQFVAVSLNGREWATASGVRAFNFDVLPSELISLAEVHKTSSADGIEGGIGGTVNVHTARPFDFHGFHSAATLAAVSDSLSGGLLSGDTTPKAFASVGWTNADSTLGWLAAVSYYKRDAAVENVLTNWNVGQTLSNNNPPKTGVSLPDSQFNDVNFGKLTRRGFNAALDWKPFDNLTVKLDSMVSEYKNDTDIFTLMVGSHNEDVGNVVVDSNNTALSFGTGFDSAHGPGSKDLIFDHTMRNSYRDEYNLMQGLNVAWQITPGDRLSLDLAYAQAWNKPGNDHTYHGRWFATGTQNTGFTPTFTNHGDNAVGTWDVSQAASITDLHNLHAQFYGVYLTNQSNKIPQARLDYEKMFDDGILNKLQAGVKIEDYRVKSVNWDNDAARGIACVYCGYIPSITDPSAIGAYLFTPPDASFFNQFAPNFAGGGWIAYDPAKVIQYVLSPAIYNQQPGTQQAINAAGNSFYPLLNKGSFSQVKELDKSFYVKGLFEGRFSGNPWVMDLGVRYVKTQTTSAAMFAPLLAIVASPTDPGNVRGQYGPVSAQLARGNYNYLLPSLNFKLNLRDDLVYRLSLSENLTRPDLGNLSANTSYSFGYADPHNPNNNNIYMGNPGLSPYLSKNADTGIEWYFEEASYVAAEAFFKKVSSFTTSITRHITLLDYPWTVHLPVNLNSATVKGLELTFNYRFSWLPAPWDGLGVASNYTLVRSNATVDPKIIALGEFGIPGMGDSANLSAYYDKGPWEARLAYNWRGKYVSSLGSPLHYTKSYGQVDLSASYKFNEHLAVFGSINNLNNERIFQYANYSNMTYYIEENGRIVMLGVRGSW